VTSASLIVYLSYIGINLIILPKENTHLPPDYDLRSINTNPFWHQTAHTDPLTINTGPLTQETPLAELLIAWCLRKIKLYLS